MESRGGTRYPHLAWSGGTLDARLPSVSQERTFLPSCLCLDTRLWGAVHVFPVPVHMFPGPLSTCPPVPVLSLAGTSPPCSSFWGLLSSFMRLLKSLPLFLFSPVEGLAPLNSFACVVLSSHEDIVPIAFQRVDRREREKKKSM